MKALMTKVFWPILSLFESNSDSSTYKPSHRTILMVVGILFVCLSVISGWTMSATGQIAALLPIGIFFMVGLVALIVGWLGTDGAVAKIWGNR